MKNHKSNLSKNKRTPQNVYINLKSIFSLRALIGMALFISGCDGKKAAKEEIEQKGITYNIDSFAEAIASKNTDVINLFIKAGIDATNPKVLGAVIESNDPILLEKLLDEDLNPNIKITTDGSNTPLLNKIVSSPEMLKVLLEADELYINAQDNEGNTALMQAMIDNQPASVTLLVTAGADVNMRNKKGFDTHTLMITDPFSWGNEPRKDEQRILVLLKALGDKLNPNANFDNVLDLNKNKHIGYSLLHYACSKSYKDIAAYLIKKGANVNAQEIDYIYGVPIKYLFIRGRVSEKDEIIANLLLDKGADKSGVLALTTHAFASDQLIKRLGGGEMYFRPRRDNIKEVVMIVKDKLMWQDNKDAKSVLLNSKEAVDYCRNLSLGGYTDWRLPNRREFGTILDEMDIVPGFLNVVDECYCTSSPNVYGEGFSPTWLFSFNYDYSCVGGQEINGHVRCVRDSK